MNTFLSYKVLIILSAIIIYSCHNEKSSIDVPEAEFHAVDAGHSGIEFVNEFKGFDVQSVLQYINVYNGGGVAIADINNDGLDDIYLTGNNVPNRLYLNKGNLQFEDITDSSGTACSNCWSNGAIWIDINNDSYEDLYVSLAYYPDPKRRANQLFINQGDLTFIEQAEKYGIADRGNSIQSLFFDYDRDGDADLFVGNHPRKRHEPLKSHYQSWLNPDHARSDHLYRNNGDNTFTDVTESSGITNYGFTLSMDGKRF